MSGFRWPRQKRQADAQAEQLKTWFISNSRWATVLEDDEFTGNRILVSDIYGDYTTAATESIIACGAPPAPGMHHAVQTFFESPVVRAAFGEFKAQCNCQENTPAVESELIQALASLAAIFGRLRLDPMNTRVSWQEARLDIGDDKLTQMVMEYLVRIEIWRLRGIANGRPWTFGTQRARYQFIASTLVQFWYMDKETCFRFREARTSSRDWSILWDSWADRCVKSDAALSIAKVEAARAGSPRLPSTDGEADEDVCFGVGWRPKGWLEKA
ncbi:hypothetical protein LEL_08573 [Akanthomyces lecanii RCEF 1005]|uniref:Uncharacterized protein n=1 Tax=Akanthomyces lecanii RCEF 1005 TaxID=1081108 RepID=A0A162MYU0_CORDF|nr:hypothetical protein LEL_08573 [Akanthomyces lecanii RCEF 1005]